MSAVRDRWGGWPLVGGCALLLVALCGGILLVAGPGEPGLRLATRTTARTSLLLFLAAYTASSLRRLWPAPATAWLLRNRRYLGVSFAVSHGIHLALIGILATRHADRFETEPATLPFTGLAYLLIAALTATSFDRSAAWLGRRRWRLLHRVGVHYLWVVFTFTMVTGALAMPSPARVLLAVLCAAALALRVAAARRAARLQPPVPVAGS